MSWSQQDCAMANLRSFVVAQYYAAPVEVQTLGHQFFNAMDRDGNGSVDYSEFKNFLVSQGFEYYAGRNLFMTLDGDKNRGLDFWEIMTLYYIIKCGKPFCVRCDNFLWDAYSVCNDCRGGPYYFCNDCYQCHLQEPAFSVQPTSSPLMAEPPNGGAMTMSSSSNYEMVAVSGSTSERGFGSKMKIAYDAFELGMNAWTVYDIVSTAASGGCSIM